MKKYCSRILAVLLTAAMALSTLPLTAAAVGGSGGSSGGSGGASMAPTSIEKVVITAVATTWPSGEPKPADITLTTANVFFIGNFGSPDAAKVTFEIRGLTQNNIWKYDMGELRGSGLFIRSDGVARIEAYSETATAGKCSYSIRIYNYQETISYDIVVTTYIAPEGSIPITIPSLNPEPELEYRDTLQFFSNVQLPKGPDYTGLRGELVAAGGGDVYAVTQPGEAADVYDTSESDTRYDAIFGQENGLGVQCSGASLNFHCGKPLVVGNYDVKLYRGQRLVATVSNAMRATKDPIVRLRSEDYYQTGETAVYTSLNLFGGTLSDLNVSLWKDGSSLATAGPPRIVRANNENSEGSFAIDVPGGLQSEGSYELKITSKSGTLLEGQTSVSIHINNDIQHLAIQQATYSNATYANFIVKAVRVTPNTTYRVELSKQNTPLATIETKPSADGVFDLEFLDATGALILLENHASYTMEFSIRDEQQHQWRNCGYAHVFTNFQTEMGNAAALAAVESYPLGVMWASGSFSGNTVEAYIETADKENLNRLSDNSKFQLRMTSVLGGQSSVLSSLTVTREPSYDPSITLINMSAPVPANTPHGYYNLELLYDGVPVIKPDTLAINVLTDGYPSEYNNERQCSTMYTTMGRNLILFGTRRDNLGGPKPVKIEFYRFGNFTATPNKTVSKTLNDGGNAFTAADLSGLNLAVKYDIVLYLDGKPVNVGQTGYLGDERLFGESLLMHSVTATQPANGRLELLPCGGGNVNAVPGWTEVYVKSTPSPGYQLKPNSVKVNGQSIHGRGFLVTDKDCTVTAEFELAPAKKYQVTALENITGGSIYLRSDYVAEGEKVSFNVWADKGYDISRVYYTSNGAQINLSNNGGSEYYFMMPANNVVVGAEFQAKQSYNITRNTPTNGTLTVENPQAWEGDYVTLRTVPSAGYHLASLTVMSNGTTVQLSRQNKDGYEFEMPANEVTVTATFAPGIGIELLQGPSLVNVEGLTDTATLIVATYDEQGKMTAVAIAPLTGPVRWLKIPIGTSNGSTKLFLFSDTGELKPLEFSRLQVWR